MLPRPATSTSDPHAVAPAEAATGGAQTNSLRAILHGAAVGAGGGLILTMLVGVAAVLAMIQMGLGPEAVAKQLHSSLNVQLFLLAGGALMAFSAGYTAAAIAMRRPYRHALWAGIATIGLKLLILLALGNPWPFWLAGIDLALVVPCALAGAWGRG